MQLGFSRRNAVRPSHHKSRRPAPKRRRLFFDALEDRRLLAAGTLSSSSQLLSVAGAASPGDALDPADVQSTAPDAYMPIGGHSVAMASNGETVVVWDDSPTNPTTNQPTGPWTLNFQLYTDNGTALTASVGGPLKDKIGNVVATNDGTAPMVAMAPTSGEFAVVWRSDSTNSYGGTVWSTYAQLYSDAGTPLTNPIQVGAAGNALPFGVAMSDNGFDVLYGARPSTKNSTEYQDLTVQRYGNTGAAVGKPITVATATLEGYSAAISADPAGNFVVGWSDVTLGRHGSSSYSTLNWHRYTSGGSALGGSKEVISATDSAVAWDLNLATDSSDDFVVTWILNTGGGIQAQAVGSNNNLLGPQINPATAGGFPSVAMEPNGGGYALSWANGGTVSAATYTLDGTVETAPFAVYTAPTFVYVASNGQSYTYSPTQSASAAIDGAGNVLVVYSGYWSDNKSTVYTDGGVFGQFYLDPLAPSAAPTLSASTASSPTGAPSSSGTPTAATDAVFAAYAYPEDDDTLG
jgi:hypothetical protein